MTNIDIGTSPVVAPSQAQRLAAARGVATVNPQLVGTHLGAVVGDSISVFGSTPGSKGNESWVASLCRLLGQRLYIPAAMNFGVGGSKIADVIATQLPAAIAAGAQVVFINTGTNDIGIAPYTSASDMVAGYQTIAEMCEANGVFAVFAPIAPRRDGYAFSTNDKRKQDHANLWLDDYVNSHRGCAFINFNPPLLDFATGNALASMMRDGLHDNNLSAWTKAKLMKQALDLLLLPANRPVILNTDYDATNNPLGNLLGNGLLTGSGGTVSSPATGAAADGYTLARSGSESITITGSKEADADLTNLVHQRIVISGTDVGATYARLYRNFSSGFSVGDSLQAMCKVKVAAGAAGLAGVSLHMRFFNGGSLISEVIDGAVNQGYGAMPSDVGEYVLMCDASEVPVSTTTVFIEVQVKPVSTGAFNATVDVSRLSCRHAPAT